MVTYPLSSLAEAPARPLAPASRITRAAARVTLVCAVVTICGATVALAGWLAGDGAAEALFAWTVPVVSAFGVLFAGAQLLALLVDRPRTARLMSVVILAIAATQIVELVFRTDFATRHLLFMTTRPVEWLRPSVPAALALLLAGAAGAVRRQSRAELYAGAAVYICAVSVVAQLYGARLLPGFSGVRPIASGTFLLLMVWAIGFFSALSGRGFGALAFARDRWGHALRRVVATAFIAPGIAGALSLAGARAGLFDPEFAIAAFAGATSLALVVVVTRYTARMRADDLRRTAAEAALAASEARYRSMIETSHDGVCVIDAEGTITFANQRLATMVGVELGELVGRTMYDFIVRDEWDEVAARQSARRDGLKAVQSDLRLKHSDGRIIQTINSTATLRDAEGRFVGALGILTDITERKLAEDDLVAQKAQLSDAQALANVGSWTLDFVSGRRSFSDVLCRLFAIDPASTDIVDQMFARMHPDDRNRMRELQRRAHEHNEPVDTEYRIVIAGETRWLLSRVRYITDDAGRAVKLVGVVQDVTDRKRHEAEMLQRARQQSAIAELGRLTLRSCDQATLQRACELLTSGLDVEYAFFAELLPGGTRLERRAGRLWRDDVPPLIDVTPQTQAGRTILGQAPVVVGDYDAAPELVTANVPLADGIRSGAMVPVASDARAFGVLAAQSREPGRFTASDVDYIQSVARMLAEAMEREQNRRAVAESEARLRRIIEGAREVIFTIAPDGTFVELNPAFEALTGCSVSEYVGRPFTEVIAPFDRERLTGLLAFMLENKTVVEDETTIVAGGRSFDLAVVSFPKIDDGKVTEIYGFARDITAARRVEQERQQLTREMELLLESTVEGIFTVDVDGRCTMINRAASELLGWTRDELAGRVLHNVVHSEVPESDCPILHVRRTGVPVTSVNDTFQRRDGASVPVEYSAAPIVDGDAVKGIVVAFTDVSARRRLEAKLEQASRLSSLGRLAATVAHEFNNVLMGISPFVEVLRKSSTPERTAMALEHIGNSVLRGRRVTADILRFTQPAEPVRKTIEVGPWLAAVAHEASSMLPPACKVRLLPVDPSLRIEGDANQLHQIFANLVLNARDAMPSGGTITIGARRAEMEVEYAFGAVESPERFAHFFVHDTGTGMDAETLHHIFEPLFTTKRNGTGLGLAVTHQVVRAHNGDIFVESKPGEGTTFHLFLPLETAVAVSIAEGAGETGDCPPS